MFFEKDHSLQDVHFVRNNQLDNDYFHLSRGRKRANARYVPMPQHPMMYRYGYWNSPVSEKARVNSIFFAGNFDPREYRKIEREGIFPVVSRLQAVELVRSICVIPGSLTELMSGVENETVENSVVIVQLDRFRIPMKELRGVLSRFELFFALPGVYMPFSHNVTEAMSSGCIPLIQDAYARLFRPPLESGVNCVSFEGENDLLQKCVEALEMEEKKKSVIRRGVLSYYDTFMTPEAVVRNLLELKEDEVMYMLASGGRSVRPAQ